MAFYGLWHNVHFHKNPVKLHLISIIDFLFEEKVGDDRVILPDL
jgi:hypothetical protein